MIPEHVLAALDQQLAPVDAARLAAYPGEPPTRQPVHTCYVPADAVVPGLVASWGETALAALDEHGLPDLGLDAGLVADVLPRVRRKLAAEPVEDLRVDAEDGYRGPPDREERAHLLHVGHLRQRDDDPWSSPVAQSTQEEIESADAAPPGGRTTGAPPRCPARRCSRRCRSAGR